MDKFNTLFQRYINKTASEQEVAEFMELVRHGAHREALEQYIQELYVQEHEELLPQERMEMLRHILPGSIKREARIVPFRMLWSAAAIALIVITAGLWIYKERLPINIGMQDEKIVSIAGKDFVRLPDGSTVLLKENSKLTYAPSFSDTEREVTLTGEAFFDVAHDPAKPFKVRTGKIVTTVLGTAFNVSSQQEKIVVTVTRGKVEVGNEDKGTYGIITPNEQIAVNTHTSEFVKTVVDSQEVVQWKQDYLILDGVTMEQAAVQIEKRFGITMTITNEKLRRCVISAWFLNDEDLEQVIKGVSAVQQATYTIENRVVTVNGGIGCNE